MPREGTRRRVNLDLCTQGRFPQGTLKCYVAHASGEHQVIFKGRTGDRKSARVPFRVSIWRIGERQVGRLPRLEIKWRRFLEIEGHSAFRNLGSVQQFALVSGGHRTSASSHEFSLDFSVKCRLSSQFGNRPFRQHVSLSLRRGAFSCQYLLNSQIQK